MLKKTANLQFIEVYDEKLDVTNNREGECDNYISREGVLSTLKGDETCSCTGFGRGIIVVGWLLMFYF